MTVKSIGRFGAAILYATTSVAALTSAAAAEEAEGAKAGEVLDVIIVSTQKRDENQRDVPITVSAYQQNFLDLLQVDDFEELSAITPGLNIQLQSPNNPGFVIRGITSDDGSFQQSPRISVFYNGVDVSRSRGSAFELFDLERVEIVKGPQATLFGTAAEIGAISVVTARPQQDYAGEAYFQYGNFNYVKAGGYVTGGNDLIQVRAAVQYRRHDGFIENIAGREGSQTPFGPVMGDLNGLDTLAGRGTLQITPNDKLTFDLILSYERNDQPGTSFKSGVIAPTGGATDPYSYAELAGPFGYSYSALSGFLMLPYGPGGANIPVPFLTDVNPDAVVEHLGKDKLGLERDLYDINATLKYDIDDEWSLTAIGAYRKFNSLEVFDADGSQVPLLEAAEDSEGKQYNAELRLNYDNGATFKGFVGANYFHEEGYQRVPLALDETVIASCFDLTTGGISPYCVNADGSFNRLDIFTGLPAPAATTPGLLYLTEYKNSGNFDTYSAFADATVTLGAVDVTAGVRYLYEEVESGMVTDYPPSVLATLLAVQAGAPINPYDLLSDDPAVLAALPTLLPGALTGDVTLSDDFSAVLPRFNILWRAGDGLNFYATVSKGRKRPAMTISSTDSDDDGFLDVSLLKAEHVWNYEAGFKALFADGAAELDGSVFYQDYKNFVVSQTLLTAGGVVTNNVDAGSAGNIGVEFSGRARPTDGLMLFGTFAYLDAKIDNNSQNLDFAGNRFRLSPKYSASAGFSYERPISAGVNGFLTTSWTYRSGVYFEAENVARAGVPISQDSLYLIDLRAGVRFNDDQYEIAGFVNNLEDKQYIIDAGNTGGGFGTPTRIAGAPRTYGVELRAKF